MIFYSLSIVVLEKKLLQLPKFLSIIFLKTSSFKKKSKHISQKASWKNFK